MVTQNSLAANLFPLQGGVSARREHSSRQGALPHQTGGSQEERLVHKSELVRPRTSKGQSAVARPPIERERERDVFF